MSNEVKPKRSVEEIQKEYTQVCAKAGHIQYNIEVLKRDLDMVFKTLGDLNLEAAASAAEAAKPKLEESK